MEVNSSIENDFCPKVENTYHILLEENLVM